MIDGKEVGVGDPESAPDALATMLSAPRGDCGYTLPTPKEPSHASVFYRTSNSQYTGHWQDGTRGTQTSSNVPKISDVLGARQTIKKPVRPLVSTAQTVLANTIEETKLKQTGDKVLSADRLPKKFPVLAHEYQYPASSKKGHDNPLYQTASQVHGKEAPLQHQVPDRYFPSANQFTNHFTSQKPRYTGLNTAWTPSNVHSALDTYY